MNDSDFSEDDQILGAFVHALSEAPDDSAKQRIFRRSIAKHPHLQGNFLQLAGMEKVLEQTQHSAEIPELPREFGEFVIIRRIGGAGMGEIYEAYHENLDRRVAIKIIRRGWTSDEAKQRFNRERLVLAKLHQTHIVPIHTAGEHDGVQYFVMPYIEGASLNFVVQAAREHHSTHSAQSTPSVGRFAEHAVSLMKSGASETVYRSDSEKAAAGSGTNGNGATPELTQPIPFWKEYHSSVARAIADVADAVGYAHAAGILHRDLKPHNIMIEPNGHVWVIDFGLAGFLKLDSDTAPVAGEHADSAKTAPSFDEHPQLTQGTGGGTPSYMAPERWKGSKANERSDVWALGATLYELLTLHRAFEGPGWKMIREQIVKQTPKPPKERVTGLPADLAAICRKAMDRDPGQRYPSAADLATDLRRWLNHEPTTALPARPPRRAALWCRRNPGWASLIGAMILMSVLLVGAEVRSATKFQAEQRQLGLRQLERIQAASHSTGWSELHSLSWSEQIWKEGTLLPLLEGEADLSNALATSLIDLDAEELYTNLTEGSEFLAFDSNGEWLVTGGVSATHESPGAPPKVFHLATETWQASKIKGVGPVAFRSDGVPVVLIPDPKDLRRVQLFNVSTSAEIAAFASIGPEQADEEGALVIALSADARFAMVARPVKTAEGERASEVTLWNVETLAQIHRCVVQNAASLSLNPEATLLAIGHANGHIGLWTVGSETAATELRQGRHPVRSMAFAKDYYRPPLDGVDPGRGSGWLLAAGDDAGGLIVWDLTLLQSRTVLRGAYNETLSLAFSPDSSLLFSVGRTPGRIWDIATGAQVLSWNHSSYTPGLAIGPHGLFASGGVPVFAPAASVRIQQLRFDRGGNVLRGLRDVARRLATSRDGSLIAALTHTFEVGVWRTDGTLLHVFGAPIGPYADNATIAISPDNLELFCCSGADAITWDLQSGSVSRTWKVAPGLVNESSYSADGKHLYLARKEVVDRSRYPLSDAPPDQFPRIVRAYDLLSEKGTAEPVIELKGTTRDAYRMDVGPNGLLVLCGAKTQSPRTSLTECWDLISGKQLWNQPLDQAFDCVVNLSPDGNRLLLRANDDKGLPEIRDTRTAAVLKERQSIYACDDKAQYSVATARNLGPRPDGSSDYTDPRYVVVYPAGESNPLVSFYFEAAQVWDAQFFEYQQRIHLAWTNDKGHVAVVDLERIRSRLATVGLGWKSPESNQ